MKKFGWMLLFSVTSLAAQQTEAAIESSEIGLSNQWQSWAFAGSALITAAAGVFVISLGNGQSTTAH